MYQGAVCHTCSSFGDTNYTSSTKTPGRQQSLWAAAAQQPDWSLCIPRHSHKKTQNQQNTIATIIKNGNCEAGRWLFDCNMCILLCYLYLCVFFNASLLMCSCEFYNRACKNMMYCYRFNSLSLNKNSGTSIKYNNKSCFHDNLWVVVTTAVNLYYKCKIKVLKLSRSIATFTWAKDHLV